MIEWYDKPWSEVVKTFGSNIYSGLDEDQITPHREKYGHNKIIMPVVPKITTLIIKQIKNLWIIMLFMALGVFIYLNQYIYAGIAVFIVVINLLCFTLSEYNDKKSLKELQKLNMGHARVVRDGRTLKIPEEELVVGDIVIVGKGESVPAELRVIESDDLKVNETSVTGENFIVEKYETKIEDKELKLSDMKNILFKASFVTSGSGTGIVIATGMNTQVSNIIKLFLGEKEGEKPFNKRINAILNSFTLLMLGALALNLCVSLFQKENIKHIIGNSSIILLNSMPQTMVIIMALISSILFNILKKQNILFKNLSVVERLASVSIICTDKVGAFSSNKMKVSTIYCNDALIDAVGEELKQGISEEKNENLYRMVNIALLCNDTKTNTGKLENTKDDLIEIALVKFGMDNGVLKRNLEKQYKRIKQIPFDRERRIMTTINAVDENYRANIKGAVDSILTRCTHIMKNGLESEITEEDIDAIKNADISMSNGCLSVIGVAYRNFIYEPSLKENIESHLVFAGLVGFENSIREDAVEGIEKSHLLNIKPVMITEDNKLTAFAIGKKLGIVSNLQQILAGVEIDNMSEDEFQRIGDKINIFSRIDSKNKVSIIRNLKEYGYSTAITGAKLVDLPVLRVSDIGITTSSSNIVRKLSDIFLKNINFLQIINVVEDCRKMVNLIKKIVIYTVSSSAAMIVFTTLICLYKRKVPLIIEEGLVLNNIVIILSSMALTYQYKNEKNGYSENVIDKNTIKENISFIAFSGMLIGVGAFAAYEVGLSRGIIFAQASAFGVLNLSCVLFLYSFSNKLFFKDRLSNLIIFINLVIQIGILFIIAGKNVFISIDYWRNIVAFIVIWLVICMFRKFDKEEIYD